MFFNINNIKPYLLIIAFYLPITQLTLNHFIRTTHPKKLQEGGRINLTRPGLGQLDMTINPLKWHDTANYTCKAKNKGGYHEWNGTVIVYCESFWAII